MGKKEDIINKERDLLMRLNEEMWYDISCSHGKGIFKLSDDFIKEYKDKVDWAVITKDYMNDMSLEFMSDMGSYIRWDIMCRGMELDIDIVRAHEVDMDWSYISRYWRIDIDLFREFSHKIRWDIVSRYRVIGDLLMDNFYDKLDKSILTSRNIRLRDNK